MKVLKIKKLSKGRYKLTFDNGSNMTLYEEVIIKNLLLVGKETDLEAQSNIASDNYRALVYHQALQYIERRRRSKAEINEYLLKKEFDEVLIDETINRLEKEGYINDKEFAKAYINDKLHLSNDGINKIRRNLANYKVSESIVEQALHDIDMHDLNDKLDKLIIRQIRLNTKYTGNMLKNKILNYLINLGYDSDIILEKLGTHQFKNNSNIQREYQKLYNKYSKKYVGYKLDMTIKQHLFQKGYDAQEIESVIK